MKNAKAHRPRAWLTFAIVAALGTAGLVLLALVESPVWWQVIIYAWLPSVLLVFLGLLLLRRRVAPFRVAQILAAVLINGYVVAYIHGTILYQGFLKRLPQPVLNCYGGPLAVFACPIGSFQQMIGMKTIPWLVIGAFVLIGAFVGRAACAWVCPFGLWQDLLHKLKAGPRAGGRRWVTLGVVAAVGLAIVAALVLWLKLDWWRPLVFAWLPFVALVGFFLVRGKAEIPARMSVGGFLAAVGLAALVWFKFGAEFGVVTVAAGMLILGLVRGSRGVAVAALAGLALGTFGPAFNLGPLSGVLLGLALALAGAGLVLLFDKALKVSLPATFIKYGFLVLVAGLASYLTIEPWFCKLCPQGTLGAGIPLVLWDPVNALRGLVGWLYWVKVGILLLVIACAVGIKRPFCRLVCPIGAIYGPFNKASLLRLKLDRPTCKSCRVCRKVCPMNIEPHEEPNQLECIRCGECAWACPGSSLRLTV